MPCLLNSPSTLNSNPQIMNSAGAFAPRLSRGGFNRPWRETRQGTTGRAHNPNRSPKDRSGSAGGRNTLASSGQLMHVFTCSNVQSGRYASDVSSPSGGRLRRADKIVRVSGPPWRMSPGLVVLCPSQRSHQRAITKQQSFSYIVDCFYL